MKKKKTVTAIIAFLIVAALGVAVYINFDTITSLIKGVTYSEDELGSLLEETKQKENEVLADISQEQIRPLTDDEAEQLANGNISEEDAVGLILGKTTMEDIQKGKYEKKQAELIDINKEKEISVETANDEIAKLVAKMYVLKSEFVNKIGAAVENTKQTYLSLPPEEMASSSVKTKLGYGLVASVNSLEADCDGRVNEIVSQIKTLLQKSGQDTALANSIKETYENEKKITKAGYVKKFMGYYQSINN